MTSADNRSGLALSVANHVPAMLAYWDKNQVCRFANKAYRDWFGRTSEEMIDKITMQQLLGPLYEKNLPFIQGALAGKTQYFERDIAVPTGDVRNSVATYTPDIEDGEVKGFFVHVADITPVKALQKELKRSEIKFKGLLEAAPDAIVIVDERGEIVLINQQAEAMFGYTREVLVGKSVEILMPPALHEQHARDRRDFFKNPRIRAMGMGRDLLAKRNDGSVFPVEISLSPLETSEGILVSAAIRDVTGRKNYERTITDAKELAETTSRQLENLLREKDDLISLFSHDMRVPLNQILGLAGVLAVSMPEAETDLKECVSKIEQSAKLQLGLYNNVLALLKADHVDQHADKEKVMLLEELEHIIADLRFQSTAKNLAIHLNVPESIAIIVQKELFTGVLQNLIVNAIKFSKPGKQIWVSAHQDEVLTTISIKDEGIGFDPGGAERLFDRFTKLGRRGTDNEASTGLGLYLSKKTIEKHRGTISAVSQGEGQGATFVIQLPNQ